MKTSLKIAISSGIRSDQGKTSITDNLIAPRLDPLVRIELDSVSSGSCKPGIHRILGSEIPELRRALFNLKAEQNLVCDIGGSEYANFMKEVSKYRSTATEFDHFICVMRSGGLKEVDALESIADLIEFGAPPERISVVFNFAPFQVSLKKLQTSLALTYPQVFAEAKRCGFNVCPTPIVEASDLYPVLFHSKKWTVDGLASAANFEGQIREQIKAGKTVDEELWHLDIAQTQARSYAKANLDAVWAEITSPKLGTQSVKKNGGQP